MKKYDVYGIGNALLDMEFDVADSFLDKMGIPKGLMTLVDFDRQQEIVHEMGADNIRNVTSGGSVANSMAAVNLFGGKGFFTCRVGNDKTGEIYHQEMQAIGLDSNFDHMDKPAGETGRCLVKVTPDSERTMNTYLGISVELSESELNFDALENSQYYYIEGYLMSSETARHAVRKAKTFAHSKGIKTALSLSDPFMVTAFKAEFEKTLEQGVDMLFANEEEALTFTGAETVAEAANALEAVSTCFAITLGSKGSLIFDGESYVEIPAEKVTPIDTVGAGDMYAGAFLYGMTNGMSFNDSAKLASMTAAQVVTQYGPRISGDDVANLLAQIKNTSVA